MREAFKFDFVSSFASKSNLMEKGTGIFVKLQQHVLWDWKYLANMVSLFDIQQNVNVLWDWQYLVKMISLFVFNKI